MKFIFKCVLAITCFMLQISATPLEEIEAYIHNAKENIQETSAAILTIPLDQQTFENTLKPWIQLLGQVSESFNALHIFTKENPSKETSQAIEKYLVFFLDVVQNNPSLYQALIKSSEKISHDTELNPFQRYLANCFIQGFPDKFIYLPGASIEKNNSGADFHVLNLESCLESSAPNLAKIILSQDADTICIQEISTDYAYDLYELLQSTYAYFLYVTPINPRLALQENQPISNVLIASKYPIEKAQFHLFKTDKKENEGYLDFIITSENMPIGHIYLALFQKNLEIQTPKLLEILEKMEIDYLDGKSIPFVLCGKLSLLEDSQEDFYFLPDYSEIALTDTESIFLTSIHIAEDNFSLPPALK